MKYHYKTSLSPDNARNGLVIRRHRVRHGLGVRELAEALDISHSLLSMMETGKRAMSRETFEKLKQEIEK